MHRVGLFLLVKLCSLSDALALVRFVCRLRLPSLHSVSLSLFPAAPCLCPGLAAHGPAAAPPCVTVSPVLASALAPQGGHLLSPA